MSSLDIKIIDKHLRNNKIIEENFFVIDSDNLDSVDSHMYGFSISKSGIITDNYYKEKGYYEEPFSQGTYVMIRKIGNEIRINQDFCGCYGIFIYQNKKKHYFALSNSFLLLQEYLSGKKKMTFNKEFADTLLVQRLVSPSIYETLIKEITILPSNSIAIINVLTKKLQIDYIDYKENSIPLESKKGIEIIDNWIDKWGYIIRSLKNQTDNISFDLSGGFDTRVTFSILLNSGIDLKSILINTSKDLKHPDHFEDLKIATNIASSYGLELNKRFLDNRSILWNNEDIFCCSIYSKLGFHKEFNWKKQFYNSPRFSFTGHGGEIIRGFPGYPIHKYIENISLDGKKINGYEKIYYSIKKLCDRSINLLKKAKKYNIDYEISSDLYFKGRTRYHFGKAAVEGFLSNIYFIQPLIDPDIKKIKYDINRKFSHDLIAFIFFRYARPLIDFPFQGNRSLNLESIKKAERLNKLIKPHKMSFDIYNKFYIDIQRLSPVTSSIGNESFHYFLEKLFCSAKFIQAVNKKYNKDIYYWVMKQNNKTNFFPLRHRYGLLAIAITSQNI